MEFKGLKVFINDYYVGDKQKQKERINIELFKIKKSFLSGKLSSYDRQKYLAKLVFISMVGHQVDFGMSQIVSLINGTKIVEKRVGWMGAVAIYGNDPNQIGDLIPELRKQLVDTKQEAQVSLALTAIASIGGSKLADSVGPSVADIAISSSTPDYVRQKAMVALSRLYQSSQQLPVVDRVAPKLGTFLQSKNLSVVFCASSLALTLLSTQSVSLLDVFPVSLEILYGFFVKNQCPKDFFRISLSIIEII